MGVWICGKVLGRQYGPNTSTYPEEARAEIRADSHVVRLILTRAIASELQRLRNPRPGAIGEWHTMSTETIATALLFHALGGHDYEDFESAVGRVVGEFIGNQSGSIPPTIDVFVEKGKDLELWPGASLTESLPDLRLHE